MNVFQVRVDPGVYFYYELAEGSYNTTSMIAHAWVKHGSMSVLPWILRRKELAYYDVKQKSPTVKIGHRFVIVVI